MVSFLSQPREGLEAVLTRVRGIKKVECSDGNIESIERIGRTDFHLAFIDLQLGWNNGITYGQKLLDYNPNLKVIIYTRKTSSVIAAEIFRHDQAAVLQLQSGLSIKTSLIDWPTKIHQYSIKHSLSLHGYILLKNVTPANLEHYFNLQQGRIFDPEIQVLLEERLSLLVLTSRERECSELIGQAKSNREIAQTLGISKQSVENLINSLYNKLSIEGKPKDPGRRVKLALMVQEWQGLDRDKLYFS